MSNSQLSYLLHNMMTRSHTDYADLEYEAMFTRPMPIIPNRWTHMLQSGTCFNVCHKRYKGAHFTLVFFLSRLLTKCKV